ncbi:MAG TPA: SIR2 family protein [Thermoanaerobaculia bacterium]|jgi:hypothetical protein
MTTAPISQLKSLIAKHRALPVIGTGASVWTTANADVANWRGLLTDGLNVCEALHVLEGAELSHARQQLAAGTSPAFIEVADAISMALNAPSGYYATWLRETIGRLTPQRFDLIEALGKLSAIFITTNYDTLIEQVLQSLAVTWLERPLLHRVTMEDESGVIHLHGLWSRPESVVFGSNSYSVLCNDVFAQTMFRTLSVTHSFIFIGFGAGLNDPNFERLRDWMRQWRQWAAYDHFRLVREADVDEATQAHDRSEGIVSIAYGSSYEELPNFLAELATARQTSAPLRPSVVRWKFLNHTTLPIFTPNLRHGAVRSLASSALVAYESSGTVLSTILYSQRSVEEQAVLNLVSANDVLHRHLDKIVNAFRASLQALSQGNRSSALDEQTLYNELHRNIFDWDVAADVAEAYAFRVMTVLVDPDRQRITVKSAPLRSTDPYTYENRAKTTTELLHFLAALSDSPIAGPIDAGIFAETPEILPLLIDAIDKGAVGTGRIRVNANDPEQWRYVNRDLEREMGVVRDTQV